MLLYLIITIFKTLYLLRIKYLNGHPALCKAMCILLRFSIFAVSSFDKLFLVCKSSDQLILKLHNYLVNYFPQYKLS